MIDRVLVEQCALCGSCGNSCPVNAITYTKKYRGFLYPSIDYNKCISCNLCEQVCPVCGDKKYSIESAFPQGYIGRSPEKHIRIQSTSGGIFASLVQEILKENGYVCGAVMDDSFHVKHILTDEWKEILRMMGSKYVQSNVGNVYHEIKLVLEKGKPVLFSGCPCQIAGLRAYLGDKPSHLYLVELVCHGIPGDEMLKGYLRLQEKRNRAKVKSIEFRCKDLGWHSSAVKVGFENGVQYLEPITVDAYMAGFLGGITLKECCYACKFKSYKAGSDLILGDFWGAEAEVPRIDDNTGLSAILVLSEAGQNILKKANLELWDMDVNVIIKYNKNILEATRMNELRTEFYDEIEAGKSYEEAIMKFLWEKPLQRRKRLIRYRLRRMKHWLQGKKETLY